MCKSNWYYIKKLDADNTLLYLVGVDTLDGNLRYSWEENCRSKLNLASALDWLALVKDLEPDTVAWIEQLKYL